MSTLHLRDDLAADVREKYATDYARKLSPRWLVLATPHHTKLLLQYERMKCEECGNEQTGGQLF